MATYNLTEKQILGPIPVTHGSLIRVTPSSGGSVTVEYTKDQESKVFNGTASYARWPIGSIYSQKEDIVKRDCYIRFTVNSGTASVLINENSTIPDNIDSDWESLLFNSGARNGHVSLMFMGDSIISRNFDTTASAMAVPISGMSNWSNWLIGSPFVFEHHCGVSGDLLNSVLSRLSYIPNDIEALAILAGINDIVAFSSGSSQSQIDTKYNSMVSSISSAISSAVNARKKIVLYTIPPNNAFNSSSDARIQLLDRVNAYIKSLASQYVFIADLFSAVWDSAQPTVRVFAANMSSDGTHLTNNGGFVAGNACKDAFKSLYAACTPNRRIYEGFQPQQILYGSFRSGTGGTAPVKTAGTGNLADGWRTINNAGTATFTLDNTELYSVSSEMVGPWVETPIGPENFWQEMNVTSAVANDNPRLRFVTLPSNSGNHIEGVFGGSEFFYEIEVLVANAVNLREVNLLAEAFFTNGTSPVDQSAIGSVSITSKSGSGTSYSITDAITSSTGWRVVLRTSTLRIPENVNMVSGVSTLLSVNAIFTGNGSALIKFARPRAWHKSFGRFG